MAVQAEPYTPVYDAFRSGQDMIGDAHGAYPRTALSARLYGARAFRTHFIGRMVRQRP